MAYINLSLQNGDSPCNGKLVTFIAPCDCGVPEGIKINGQEYKLVDALGNDLLGYHGIFAKNAIIAVILDVTNSKAYIQNSASAQIDRITNDQIDALDETPIEITAGSIATEDDIDSMLKETLTT